MTNEKSNLCKIKEKKENGSLQFSLPNEQNKKGNRKKLKVAETVQTTVLLVLFGP